MHPAIFLDRDGVLNHLVLRDGVPASPRCPHEFRLIESAAEAVKTFRRAGFLCFVVTNQPDLGAGLISTEVLREMHQRLKEAMPINAIYVCGHESKDLCGCRKPKPGMILQAEVAYDLDLRQSWLIGDRWVDIAAANAVGVKAVMVEHAFSMSPTSAGTPPENLKTEARVNDLVKAAESILRSDYSKTD